jgi:lysophospholipase L1-like esterase
MANLASSEKPPQEKSLLINLGKNLLLVFLGLTIGLVLMEGVLRIYNPLGFRIKGDKIVLPVNQNWIKHHDDSPKLDKITYIHRNSLGFMGEEPPADFADRLTIVAVGGSTTECLELASDRTWPLVMAPKLKEDFKNVWINNAGLAGQSTYGHLVLMQDYIAKIKPKVVLFLIGINEVGRKGVNSFELEMNKGINLRSLDGFLSGLADFSEVSAALLNQKRYYFPKIKLQFAHDNQIKDLKAVPTMEVSAQEEAAVKRLHEAKYLQPFTTRLKGLVEISKANGILPVLVTQPILYGNLIDPTTGVDLRKVKITDDMNGKLAWEVLELYNDVTRRVGRENGLLVIDLAREMPKDSGYYYNFMHYDNEGAAKVAEIICRDLRPYLAENFPQYLQVRQLH